jgi:hypothetical protein
VKVDHRQSVDARVQLGLQLGLAPHLSDQFDRFLNWLTKDQMTDQEAAQVGEDLKGAAAGFKQAAGDAPKTIAPPVVVS